MRKITTVNVLEILLGAWERGAKLTVGGITKKLTGRKFPEKRHFARTWAIVGSLKKKGAVTLYGNVVGFRPPQSRRRAA